MKIKSIYIDGLHNATNKTYELSDLVYFYGRNGVGKSTILQAIQLALLGYIPGSHKTKEAILKHSRDDKVLVRLELDNNVSIERRYDSKSSKTTITPEDFDIQDIISDTELPIFNFNEFVGQTANKLKEYFIKNILPITDGNLDWKQILEESITDCNFQNREEIISYGLELLGNLDGDILEQVISANTKFKEEQSFVKAKLQRLQNTIDSLIYYDDYTGPTNLNDINSNLLSLGALRDQLLKYESATEAMKSASEELSRLEEHITMLGGKEGYEYSTSILPQIQAEYDELVEKIAKNRDILSTIIARDTIIENIINNKGICPYTKESCKSIHDKLDSFSSDSIKYKAKKAEFEEAIAKLEKMLNIKKVNIRNVESNINDYNTTWERIDSLKKTLNNLPQKPEIDKTLADLDNELELYNDYKTKLLANNTYNETIEAITKEKYEAELQQTALSNWVKKTDTNGLQTTLMVQPFEELANKMTSYIQNMYGDTSLKANFNISSKANSFSFGLIRDEKYIPYEQLSSGEKCLYTLALMICITDNGKSPLKVMLCDDMFDHLDSIAIENTFKSLKEMKDIQFIFAGVKECKNAEDVTINL